MSLAAAVYGTLPKGNISVHVADSPAGPVVTHIKGLRGGSEWVLNAIQGALSYDHTGIPTVRWADTDIPASLRRNIVVRIR